MDIRAFIDKILKNKFLLGLLTGAAVVFAIWGCVAAFQSGGGRGSDSGDEAGFLAEEAGKGSGDEGPEQPRAIAVESGSAAGDEVYEFGFPVSEYEAVEGRIRRGEFFSTLMSRLGASQSDIYGLDALAKGVFDMRQIKAGYEYHAYYTRDSLHALAYLVYEKDNMSYVLFSLRDSLSVTVHEKDIRTVTDYVDVIIRTSLWEDVLASEAPALLAVKLADIYAWSIDFFGLREGDSFKAVYQKLVYGDEVLSVEDILFAEFEHGGETFRAYYFDNGSGNYYWNEKGESMRKAFLKAPLSYTRISSGFSYSRRHPITRRVRPHTGIDYAAPAGTEVMSIGDGVVVYRGYKKAEGNMVKIKHNSVYTSAYLHLSKYASGLKVGQRVRQGQVIGYVGSTGYSTGPHLDFRIWKNGTPINPLKMESPPAEPIAKGEREKFAAAVSEAGKMASSYMAAEFVMRAVDRMRGK